MRVRFRRVWLPPGDYEGKPAPGAQDQVSNGSELMSRRPGFRCLRYCCGTTEPSQVEIAAELERTTASANEQK